MPKKTAAPAPAPAPAAAPAAAAAAKPAAKGHRQKGAGTVVVGKSEVTVAGIVMAEWQRTPQTLLNDYIQHNKRPRPIFSSLPGRGNRYRLTLPDPKHPGGDKDLHFSPSDDAVFEDDLSAKHTIALLALHRLEPDRPHERKLPEPYRTLWLKLSGEAAPAPPPAKETAKPKGGARGKAGDEDAAAAARPAAATTSADETRKAPAAASSASTAARISESSSVSTAAITPAAAPVPPTSAAPTPIAATTPAPAPAATSTSSSAGRALAAARPPATAAPAADAAAAATPAVPPKRVASTNISLDVQLKTQTLTHAERTRERNERDRRRRERENKRKARLDAVAAKNRDAIVEMTPAMRELIEDALRDLMAATAGDAEDELAGAALAQKRQERETLQLSDDIQDEVEAEILEAGFSQEQAETAVQAIRSKLENGDTSFMPAQRGDDQTFAPAAVAAACIDWLVLHVPEAEMPTSFAAKAPTIRLVQSIGAAAPPPAAAVPAVTPPPPPKLPSVQLRELLSTSVTKSDVHPDASCLARIQNALGWSASDVNALLKGLRSPVAASLSDDDVFVAAMELASSVYDCLNDNGASIADGLQKSQSLPAGALTAPDAQRSELDAMEAVFGADFSSQKLTVSQRSRALLLAEPPVDATTDAAAPMAWLQVCVRSVGLYSAKSDPSSELIAHACFMYESEAESWADVAAQRELYPQRMPASWVSLPTTAAQIYYKGDRSISRFDAQVALSCLLCQCRRAAAEVSGGDAFVFAAVQQFVAGIDDALAALLPAAPTPAPTTVTPKAPVPMPSSKLLPRSAKSSKPTKPRRFDQHMHKTPGQLAAMEATMARDDAQWKTAAVAKRSDPAWRAMQAARSRLPVSSYRDDILRTIADNQVVLLSGETGCGKTTQVPQFILEDAIERGLGGHTRIIVTQPRRLAATGVAKRVADERVEPLGTVGGAVGYQIRGEKRAHPGTSLLFTTTGVLLRRLNSGLGHVTHIVVDEVHERNVDTDFLLAVLRSLLRLRPDVKVLLMSATMDAEVFAAYFREFAVGRASAGRGASIPVISVPGRTFPVREVYLSEILACTGYVPSMKGAMRDADDAPEVSGDEDGTPADSTPRAGPDVNPHAWKRRPIDFTLIARLITYLSSPEGAAARSGTGTPEDDDNGSILVFLPGVPEIRKLQRAIEKNGSVGHLHVLPLHGGLSSEEQSRVFARPPHGKRKVVLATNVAETSITIDDVTVVVDTMRVKESQYDHANGTSRLVETWTSLAAAKQRRGRAGRVRPGVCYRVVPHSMLPLLRTHTVPEIQRTSLESLCLQVSLLDLGQVHDFMQTLLDPPQRSAVQTAVQILLQLGAYVSHAHPADAWKSVDLTPLGFHLAQLPIAVHLGKALILACVLRCIDPVLTIAAALSDRSPFRPIPYELSDDERAAVVAARERLSWAASDHLTVVKAFDAWRGCANWAERRELCAATFTSHESFQSMQDLRKDFAEVLQDLGFLPAERPRDVDRDTWGWCGERSPSMNEYSDQPGVIRAALVGGFYPRVCKIVAPPRKYAKTVGGAVPKDYTAIELALYTLVGRTAAPPRPAPTKPPVADDSSSDGSGDDDEAAVLAEDPPAEPAASTEVSAAPPRSGVFKEYKGFSLERVWIHPASVAFSVGEWRSPWLVFHEKASTGSSSASARPRTFLRDVSMASPYALLCFGGHVHVDTRSGMLGVGDGPTARDCWIQFHADVRIGALVRRLRTCMHSLLAAKIATPALDISAHPVAHALVTLIATNGTYVRG